MKSMALFGGFFYRWFVRPAPTPDPIPDPTPTPDPVPPIAGDLVKELLKLHNDARRSDLALNSKLIIAAQKHAEWMAKYNRMSHTGVGGSSFWDRIVAAGYKPRTGGENVAMGYSTVNAVFKGWMNSAGHRANILNSSYKEVGFGIATSSNGSKYWCTNFGTSQDAASVENITRDFVLSGPLTGQD